MFSNFRNLIFALIAFVCLLSIGCLGCFDFSSSVSPEVFIQQAVNEMKAKNLEHSTNWGLGQEKNWVANHEQGTITFMFADGTQVTAPMQIVGTYNIADGTFKWGWDHPNVREPLRKHAELALKFGQDNQLTNFTTPVVACTENDAWAFTYTAAKLGNANGVYEGPTGDTLLFMTFGEVLVSK